jgi:hypothetical protein
MQKERNVFAPLNMNPDYPHIPRCGCHNFNLPLSVRRHFSSNSCIPLVVFLHFPPYFAYSCQGHASDNQTPPKGNTDQLDPRRFVWRLSSPKVLFLHFTYINCRVVTSLTMQGNTGFKSRHDTGFFGDFLQLLSQNAEKVR